MFGNKEEEYKWRERILPTNMISILSTIYCIITYTFLHMLLSYNNDNSMSLLFVKVLRFMVVDFTSTTISNAFYRFVRNQIRLISGPYNMRTIHLLGYLIWLGLHCCCCCSI